MNTTATPVADPAARDAALTLLASRSPDATACPSEVARVLVAGMPAGAWRGQMLAVHAAIDELLAEGRVRLLWKGRPLATRSGPYRIALATAPPPVG